MSLRVTYLEFGEKKLFKVEGVEGSVRDKYFSYLGEQPRHRESIEHSGTHDDGDLQSKRKSDQLVSVALDEVSI